VKGILRYIARGSHDHGVRYERGKAGELLLLGYSNSDVTGDVVDNRSTSGNLFYLVKNPITWQSQKQKSMSLSSCEVEYMASSAAACEVIWFVGLLS
jgi:hypothetical protein